MDEKELKQKIRKLKRLELKIRYGFSEEFINKNTSADKIEKLPLVWKDFFDLSSSGINKARYKFNELKQMDKDSIKQVFGEFWFFVYYRMYHANGLNTSNEPEPELLDFLGLPYNADQAAIRRRFRELCKQYHPDEGGDQYKFLELMKVKEKFKF
jgi:hypothetical protein